MSDAVTMDLFVEDQAHEKFMIALVARIAKEEERLVRPRVRAARGGRGRVFSELALYQKGAQRHFGGMTLPDLLVVAIDANCTDYQKKRREIQERLLLPFRDLAAIACPDPHIELWYLADVDSFQQVVGARPDTGRDKCERDHYKRILKKAIAAAGHPPTLGGIEFASEIVEKMDLYRAGARHGSLKTAVDDVRQLLKSK